jgi:hypothetical protein
MYMCVCLYVCTPLSPAPPPAERASGTVSLLPATQPPSVRGSSTSPQTLITSRAHLRGYVDGCVGVGVLLGVGWGGWLGVGVMGGCEDGGHIDMACTWPLAHGQMWEYLASRRRMKLWRVLVSCAMVLLHSRGRHIWKRARGERVG